MLGSNIFRAAESWLMGVGMGVTLVVVGILGVAPSLGVGMGFSMVVVGTSGVAPSMDLPIGSVVMGSGLC